MTSDTTPSPNVVSASSEAGVGTEAFMAFDKDSVSGCWQVASGTTGWIKYDFGSALWAANGYTLTALTGNRAPKNWTFAGSNNDSSYTTLDTQTGITFTDGQTKTYSFTNSTKYRYYKLTITVGDTAPLELAEETILAPSASQGSFLIFF